VQLRESGRSAAVVGAGIAGLTAARELVRHGFVVQVFDKGRAAGGRVATRRYDDTRGLFSFDHGAQYFTIRDHEFAAALAPLIEAGSIRPWEGRFGVWDGQHLALETSGTARFVGAPGMSALARGFAATLDITFGVQVTRLSEHPGRGWTMVLESGEVTTCFDTVVVAVPDAQARSLFLASGLPDLADRLPPAALAPCWAVMVGFAQRLATEFDGIFSNEGLLSWAARNSSKPLRPGGADAWVLHLASSPSASRIDDAKDSIARDALSALRRMLKVECWSEPIFLESHRWRYATIANRYEHDFIHVPERRLGVCGDWLSAGRVEGAFLSGLRLARHIAPRASDSSGLSGRQT